MKNFKKVIAAAMGACLLTTSLPAVYATDHSASAEQVMPGEEGYGEFISDYVDRIVEHLSVYAIEGVNGLTLYRAGLLDVLKNHPELYEEVMSAVLSSIDEHSVFFRSGEFNDFISSLEGSVGGIGVVISENENGLMISSVSENSPAEKAGLMAGDIIVSADDVSLSGMTISQGQSYVRGEVGTKVTIGIMREGYSDILYFDIIREEIGFKESVQYKIFPAETEDKNSKDNKDNEDIMYIKIWSFMDNSAELFKKAMDEAEEKNIKNFIIDVRDNGGGYVVQAVDIANHFVPSEKTIITEDHKVDLFDIVYTANDEYKKHDDVVVLVNEYSASASEILTAAICENGVGVSIGNQTYGKGTVQSMLMLKDDEAMKYTVAGYLTPLGNNINGVGITPDAVVENTYLPFDTSDYENFSYSDIYTIGQSSNEVIKAKKILNAIGLYSGDITSPYFDSELEYAIYDFQGYKQLYPYGVLDKTTQNALYTYLCEMKVEVDNQLDAAFNHFGQNYLK